MYMIIIDNNYTTKYFITDDIVDCSTNNSINIEKLKDNYNIDNTNISYGFDEYENSINDSTNTSTSDEYSKNKSKPKSNYNNWMLIIDSIVDKIINTKINNNKKLYNTLKEIREQFYILFITNIQTQMIICEMMKKILKLTNDIYLKYKIIDITSKNEELLTHGTRHIIHFENYIIKLLYLFNDYK